MTASAKNIYILLDRLIITMRSCMRFDGKIESGDEINHLRWFQETRISYLQSSFH